MIVVDNVVEIKEECDPEEAGEKIYVHDGISDVHERKKDFICKTCGKAFTRKQTLESHVSTKHGKREEKEKDFMCSLCGKAFHSKRGLQKHISGFHEGKKDFMCSFCGKAFYKSDGLQYHISASHEPKQNISVDVEKKNFTCLTCGKSFPTEYDLNTHVSSVHEGEKKFKCLIDVPEEHEQIDEQNQNYEKIGKVLDPRAEIKFYICPICEGKFKSFSLTDNHMVEFHQISEDVQEQMASVGIKIMEELPIPETKIYICPICKENFESFSLTENHMAEFHHISKDVQEKMSFVGIKIIEEVHQTIPDPKPEIKYYICPLCKLKFKSVSLTEEHISVFHQISEDLQQQMASAGIKIEEELQ